MAIDIRTLVMILGFTHLMQVVVFIHQFRINKTYQGVGWWLLWSAAEVIGFGVIFLRNIPSILPLVIIIQNLMLVGGTVFLYIGVKQFLNKNVNLKLIIPVVSVFFAGILFFLFIDNNIQVRSVLFSALLAIISFFTAYSLFVDKPGRISAAANFTGVVFLIHGGIFVYRTIMISAGTSVEDFFTPTIFNLLPYFDALIVSLLWTFGLIIMLNQRLNIEMMEAKEELQLIFNTSPDAAMITRLTDGLIMDVNEGYTIISGYTREEMIGKSTAEVNIWKHIEDRDKVVSILKKQGYCENFEADFVIKSGIEITGLMSAKVINIHGVPNIISITRNITDRKQIEAEVGKLLEASERSRMNILSILEDHMQAQEALRESERKFRETVINLDEGYYSVTMDGILLEYNLAFTSILGFDSLAVLTGTYMPDFWQNPEDRNVYLKKLIAEGSIVSYQTKAKKLSGEIITLLLSAHIVKNKENLPVRIEGVFVDISQRMRAEMEIQNLNKVLEQRVIERTALLEASNKELEAFSYSVSHDLRAPLRHINSFVDLLSNQFKNELPYKAIHYLNTISRASNQMGSLIDALLQYSRTGRQEIRKSELDMNLMVNEVTHLLKTGLKDREIIWDIQNLPIVSGDNVLLKQVWTNLLDNAVKYTRNIKPSEISVGCTEESKDFVFWVKDNGAGFDMKYAHKLFGVFQRLHSQTEFEGNGIGLANVQSIVNKHLGRVWAEAEPGKGAKFYFSLPK
ncbi:MAG: PAS domain S-box protein [Ignavibacteriaceae bacterium]